MRTERRKSLPDVFEHDCRLVYERRTGYFYLCVPLAAVSRPDPEIQGDRTGNRAASNATDDPVPPATKGIVAIDPGMRTFGTCYDPDGTIHEWATGSDHLALLYRLDRKAGRIERRAAAIGGRKKRRLVAVGDRIRKRSVNLVNELHRKFSLWLCRNYSVVLLPKFDTRPMVRKRSDGGTWTRKIGRKTAGGAMRLAHYRFRNFLTHKATEFGTTIEICDERYTSMTCGSCGSFNRDLGASKTFRCNTCGYVADRDHNAARNILLRYLTLNDIRLEDASRRSRDASGGLL